MASGREGTYSGLTFCTLKLPADIPSRPFIKHAKSLDHELENSFSFLSILSYNYNVWPERKPTKDIIKSECKNASEEESDTGKTLWQKQHK